MTASFLPVAAPFCFSEPAMWGGSAPPGGERWGFRPHPGQLAMDAQYRGAVGTVGAVDRVGDVERRRDHGQLAAGPEESHCGPQLGCERRFGGQPTLGFDNVDLAR